MGVRIELEYAGDLHTNATHPSGETLATDAPKDNEGRGQAFSPTDLVATALGSCMLTVMGIVARRHDWKLEGSRVSVDKEMVADPQRRIGALRLRFAMAPGISEEARTVLERAARTCPVAESIGKSIETDVAFDWPD